MRVLKVKRTFRKELKRQIKYAIAAAVGFIIAFAWRDAIFNVVNAMVKKFEESTEVTSQFATSIIITLIGVLIIIISSRLLRDK